MMNEFDKENLSMPTATASAQIDSPQGIFLGKSHAGRFVVTRVEQTPERRESHVPGLFIVPFRITLGVKKTLPALENKQFVLGGSKGEGMESGALGLQDWLPTTIGEEVVLAFDPKQMENAAEVVFIGRGATVEKLWLSVEQYYGLFQGKATIDPSRVAIALKGTPAPDSTFFNLLFNFQRSIYQDVNVMRALGGYLGNSQLSASDRRTVVAHYMDAPNRNNADALRELLGGMLRLVLDLSAAGQSSSVSVVLQRIFGYGFDSGSNQSLVTRPDIGDAQRLALDQILSSPNTGINSDVRRSLRSWIGATK